MKLIVANWKMQLGLCASVDLAKAIKKAVAKTSAEVVVCPSFTALEAVGKALGTSAVGLGAQNVFTEMVGAHTGEISPLHLGELGVQFVIVGHSERRANGETNADINKKVIAVLAAGMTPIICVGETKAEHKARKTQAVITTQVKAAVKDLHTRAKERVVFAYEPVWAIGSGNAAEPADAAHVHTLIRKTVMVSIAGIKSKQVMVLYGGSVSPQNAQAFLNQQEVDGALVGNASLDVESFKMIVPSV